MALETSARFDGRVQNYLRYRPRYPRQIIPFLHRKIGLSRDWRVADIGSGAGFLAERFVDLGCEVVGAEPNAAMRAAGDQYLHGRENFRSVDPTAESTGLPEASFDLVTAGQGWLPILICRVATRAPVRLPFLCHFGMVEVL